MIPGWNPMRQPGPPMPMNRNPQMMGGANMMMGGGNPMMPNYGMNQPYPIGGGPPMMYQQPYMQQPMYQPMMNSYSNMGNHPQMNQQALSMQAPLPNNAPNQPPPPAPCEPPPTSSAPLPPVDDKKSLSQPQPPPPDSAKEWWKTELEKLSGASRIELQQLTVTDWFLSMTTNQQIEHWQHKMQLKSQQEQAKGDGTGEVKSQNLNQSSTSSSATPEEKQQSTKSEISSSQALKPSEEVAPEWDKSSGENPQDALTRYQQQLKKLNEQAEVFEKQYNDWRKQFDDWKEKHRNHPNKTQFNQYEKQWVTWQKQMLEQKTQNEANKKKLLDNIGKIEQTIEEEKKRKEQEEQMKKKLEAAQNVANQSFSRPGNYQQQTATLNFSTASNIPPASYQMSNINQQPMWRSGGQPYQNAPHGMNAPNFHQNFQPAPYTQPHPSGPLFMGGDSNYNYSINQQNQPMAQYSQAMHPQNQHNQFINQPNQSMNQLNQPINLLNQPMNQPSHPMNQPHQPINQPNRPINQPYQPINQPNTPMSMQNQSNQLSQTGNQQNVDFTNQQWAPMSQNQPRAPGFYHPRPPMPQNSFPKEEPLHSGANNSNYPPKCEYDAKGNLIPPSDRIQQQSHEHDTSKSIFSSSSSKQEQFEYDSEGNRINSSSNMQQRSIQYDVEGNVIKSSEITPNRSIEYDAEGNLINSSSNLHQQSSNKSNFEPTSGFSNSFPQNRSFEQKQHSQDFSLQSFENASDQRSSYSNSTSNHRHPSQFENSFEQRQRFPPNLPKPPTFPGNMKQRPRFPQVSNLPQKNQYPQEDSDSMPYRKGSQDQFNLSDMTQKNLQHQLGSEEKDRFEGSSQVSPKFSDDINQIDGNYANKQQKKQLSDDYNPRERLSGNLQQEQRFRGNMQEIHEYSSDMQQSNFNDNAPDTRRFPEGRHHRQRFGIESQSESHFEDKISHRQRYSEDDQQKQRFSIDSQQRHRFPGDGLQRHRFSGDAQQRQRFPGDAQQRQRFPGDTQQRQRFPGDTQQRQRFPGDAQQRQRFPGDAQQRQRFPGDVQQRQRFPGDAQQRQRFPGDVQQRPRFPGDVQQRPRFPGDSQQRQRFPGDVQQRQRFPGDTHQRQRFSMDAQHRQRFPGDVHQRQKFSEDEWQKHRFPGDAQQRRRFPGEAQQRQRFPGNDQQRQRFPGDSQQRQRFPGDSQQRQRFPGDGRLRQRSPGDLQLRQRFLGDTHHRQRSPEDAQQRPRYPGDLKSRPRFPGDVHQRQRFPGDAQQRQRFPGEKLQRPRFPESSLQKPKFPHELLKQSPVSSKKEHITQEGKVLLKSPHLPNDGSKETSNLNTSTQEQTDIVSSSANESDKNTNLNQDKIGQDKKGGEKLEVKLDKKESVDFSKDDDYNDWKDLANISDDSKKKLSNKNESGVFVDGKEVSDYLKENSAKESSSRSRQPQEKPIGTRSEPPFTKEKPFNRHLKGNSQVNEFGDSFVIVEDDFTAGHSTNFNPNSGPLLRHPKQHLDKHPQPLLRRPYEPGSHPRFENPPGPQRFSDKPRHIWDEDDWTKPRQDYGARSNRMEARSFKGDINLNDARKLVQNNPLFTEENMKKLQAQIKAITQQNKQRPDNQEVQASQDNKDSVDKQKILEKARNLSTVDLKNILSAVKLASVLKAEKRENQSESSSKGRQGTDNRDNPRKSGEKVPQSVDPLLDSLEELAAAGALENDDLLQEYLKANPILEEELYLRAMEDKDLLAEAERLGGFPKWDEGRKPYSLLHPRESHGDLGKPDWARGRANKRGSFGDFPPGPRREQEFGYPPRGGGRIGRGEGRPMERQMRNKSFDGQRPGELKRRGGSPFRDLRDANQRDLERQSIERRHQAISRDLESVKQRRETLDSIFVYNEREDERMQRERSLERLRIRESELLEREEEILARERLLRDALRQYSPDRKRPFDNKNRPDDPQIRRGPPEGRRGLHPDEMRRGPPDDRQRGRPDDMRRGPPGRGPPDDMRRRPPDEMRRGPPDDMRRGPPDDMRRGLPDDMRRGPPDDMRRGPPDDMRRGPPDDMRRRPPDDMRRGPPDDLRRGPPDDIRRRPLDDTRRGPPDDIKRGRPDDMRRIPPDDLRRGPPGDVRRLPLDDKGRGPPGNMRRGSPEIGRRGSSDDMRREPPGDSRRGPPTDMRRGPPEEIRRGPDDTGRGPPENIRRVPGDIRRGPPDEVRRGPSDDIRRAPFSDIRRGGPLDDTKRVSSDELGGDRFRQNENLPRNRNRPPVRRRSMSPQREDFRREMIGRGRKLSPRRGGSPPRKMRRSRSRSPPKGTKNEHDRDLPYRNRPAGHLSSPHAHEHSPRRGEADKRLDRTSAHKPTLPQQTTPPKNQEHSSVSSPKPFADLEEVLEPENNVPPAPLRVNIEDIINMPGRLKRPSKVVVILRGLPGSGKTHIAKTIRDKENEFKVSPRVLSLDDYFMAEVEKTIRDDSGKTFKKRVLEYEYEEEMEESYRGNLIRSFKKTLDDGYFTFVIMDAINDKLDYFKECYNSAKAAGFEAYVAEIVADVHECAKRNAHGRALAEIQALSKGWEKTPEEMNQIDLRQLLQDSSIQEVEMGDVTDSDEENEKKEEKEDQEKPAPTASASQEVDIPKSKWETESAASQLDKLDGIRKKKTVKQSMEDFLSVTDDYNARQSAPGKKRVRWADINERQNQKRMREVGFVVGQTDWSRMMDDSHATQALNRTKFI